MSIKFSTTGTTFDGGTVLQIKTGNQGSGKVLVSDSDGLVDWVGVKGLVSQDRYIGELYGGGIVVNIWQEGSSENVLIASLQDATSTSTIPSTTTEYAVGWSAYGAAFAGATSLYDGKTNNAKALGWYSWNDFGTTAAAIDFDDLNNTGNVGPLVSDWYLPSLYEMRTIWNSAAVINKVLGEHNFKFGVRDGVSAKYWTSTEVNATQAWMLNLTGLGNFATASKSDNARIRPVRLERKTIGNGLVTYLDATDKRSYNDSTLSGRWVDLVNSGLTSSYSFTFSSINSTGPTYSTQESGYLNFNGNSFINFASPIGDVNVVTVEMWARIKPQSANRMLFGWSNYDVYWVSDKGLGFNTGDGDVYGIPTATVTSLGIVDRWVHYVFEMRSGVNYSNNRIYIDGQLQTTLVQCVGTQNIGNTNFSGGNGRIGCWTSSLLTIGGTPYLGVFDLSVFKVYKRALTQTEITDGFNKYRRKYEIGITSTHFIDMTTNPGTFSIVQNMKVNIAGKKNQRLLASSTNGTASWVDKNYLFYRPDNQRFVGEFYGGGIIVSAYNYPTNVFNYIIMSKDDINQIVTEFKYGGSTATRLTVSYDLTSWLSIGQIAKFVVGGVSKSIAITSVVSDSSMITNSSGTLNLAIPDQTSGGNPGTTLVSPALFVDQQIIPTLIEVVVNITHTWVTDLRINLISPSGKVITLFNQTNGDVDNFTNTVFSTNLTLASITTGTAPFTGTFRMSAVSGIVTGTYTSNATTLTELLDGKTVNGNWYLAIQDYGTNDTGTLLNWSLKFSGTRTTILLNETLTSTTTYESSKNVVIGATGLSIPWSVRNNLVLTNNFDGSINSNAVLALGYTNSSAALLCDFYNSDGWGDWYLPSSYELVNAFDALASVGYVSGTDSVSGDYWTSTNTIFSNAFYVRTSGGSMSNLLVDGSKSSLKKVRAFRKVSILSNYKTWGSANPYDEPVEGWYTEAWDEKNWNNYPKLKTSNLIFDFRTDNLFCYTGRLGPYTTTAQSTVGGYTGTLKTGVTWSSDYNALSFNGTYSTTVLSNSYLVFSNYVSPTPSSNITMETWVYPTHNSQGTGGRPILSTNGWEASASAYAGYSISLSSNNNTDTYSVLVDVGNGGGNGFQYRKSYSTGSSVRPVFRNKWNHIVVIMNGINIVQIYVNNRAYPIAPPTGDQNIDGTATTVNTTLAGTKMLIGAGYGGIFSIFDGYIGAVRVYNTNLSVTDVKYNFEYDRVRYDV